MASFRDRHPAEARCKLRWQGAAPAPAPLLATTPHRPSPSPPFPPPSGSASRAHPSPPPPPPRWAGPGRAGRAGAAPGLLALRRRRAALGGAARAAAARVPHARGPERRLPSPRRRDGGGQRVCGQPAEPGAGRPGHVRDRRGQ